MARIEYLTLQEIKKFDSAPVFSSSSERNYFFSLPNQIYKQANNLENDSAFVVFALMFGYFKATNKFFEPTQFHQEDIIFIATQYQLEFLNIKDIGQKSRTLQRYST